MKRHCLIIAVVFLLGYIVGMVSLLGANAETSALVVYEPETDAFEQGFGLELNTEHRLKSFAIGGSGSIMDQKKHGASDGYTWGADVYGKWFPVDQFFIGSGWCWHGYRSRFSDHASWEKQANQPMIMAGIQSLDTEIRLTYWPRETCTVNRVSAFGVGVKQHLTDIIIVASDFQVTKHTQAGEHESDIGVALGAGVYF